MTTIKFDYSPLTKFVHENELPEIQKMVTACDDELRHKTGAGKDFIGYVDLPVEYDHEEFDRIKKAAAKIRQDSEVFVAIGIGGSYLGARMACDFLNLNYGNWQKDHEGPIVLFAGNSISGTYLQEILDLIGDKSFSINVISKSGTTTEPSIAFRVLKKKLVDKYGKEEAAKRIYATTDKAKGALKTEADAEGYEEFVVPDAIGGRYSVMSAVGLLPIAVAGGDIDKLMEGFAAGREAYSNPDLSQNEAYQYAALRNILMRKGYNVEILENYEPSLQYLGEWWKQLAGESEGKDQKGIYPSSANFSTDLHSLGQYIQEGQRFLFETVVMVDHPKYDVEIPVEEEDLDGLKYLEGKNMNYVNEQAYRGVVIAHTDGGVPVMTIHIDQQDEFTLGQLVYFFEIAIGISGYLNGINPFNQPGVEDYKRNMFALLGKPGFEEQTNEIKQREGDFF
ncbi:glucose-6-phosphate isomerase [Xylocopilactobacillus apicola]|uniref:Glucose-6-phosphate isomerase n=1 Tax=Xylocopilactobacillus apicola TaxID=2932184 RepID=A0AAU9DNS5_9LACO|nr:glucose-6-phosphate isomerase [Xylocopilactobacillus apicola]BDR58752.1 glucose-6-phosphate isomerase [Xylocopilactobacillus apicola]